MPKRVIENGMSNVVVPGYIGLPIPNSTIERIEVLTYNLKVRDPLRLKYQ